MTLRQLVLVGLMALGVPVFAADADIWRAASRVGYGPSVALLAQIAAAPGPRQWALQQVDDAYAASQTAPRIAPDRNLFNAPLPALFAGWREERRLRLQVRAGDSGTPAMPTSPPSPMGFFADQGPENFSRTVARQAAAWRLQACSQPEEENPLLARMTEFWFNHLNVFVGKGSVRPFVGHYVVHVARAHALGRFEDLLLASARHPAMLYYLDQVQSVAPGTRAPQGGTRGLNENYARELLELHTLGAQGGYNQTDVRELARVLTGWGAAPNEASGYRFYPRLHDTGSKKVLGQTFARSILEVGEREGEEAIRLLARHPSTALRVSERLARHFVADQPNPALVRQLAQVFMATQGDLRSVMRTLLGSPDFWQAEHRLFKTPLDYACSVLTSTPGAQDPRRLTLTLGFLDNAGQAMHGWQTPDGYSVDAATWLVPEALTRRADFALAMARQSPEPEFLWPHLGPATQEALRRERPAVRGGLMLASPEFMYK